MKTTLLKQFTIAALSLSFAALSFADEAPVYDVDSYSPTVIQQGENAPSSSESAINGEQANAENQGASEVSSLPVEDRLARVEQQMNNVIQSASSEKLDSLQNELQSLRGQVEEMTHQLQQMQAQQKNMYSDLDKRVSGMRLASSTNVTAAGSLMPDKTLKAVADLKNTKVAKNTTEPNVLEEQQTYQTAYNLIKVKKYDEAIASLQSMLKKYPSGQFAANAHYWLGELYGLMGKNTRSAEEFNYIIKNFPSSPKISDAELKLGLIHASSGNWSKAKEVFKMVISDYPGTAPARLAAQQLKEMRTAGH